MGPRGTTTGLSLIHPAVEGIPKTKILGAPTWAFVPLWVANAYKPEAAISIASANQGADVCADRRCRTNANLPVSPEVPARCDSSFVHSIFNPHAGARTRDSRAGR